jgi:hypothetical protein
MKDPFDALIPPKPSPDRVIDCSRFGHLPAPQEGIKYYSSRLKGTVHMRCCNTCGLVYWDLTVFEKEEEEKS